MRRRCSDSSARARSAFRRSRRVAAASPPPPASREIHGVVPADPVLQQPEQGDRPGAVALPRDPRRRAIARRDRHGASGASRRRRRRAENICSLSFFSFAPPFPRSSHACAGPAFPRADRRRCSNTKSSLKARTVWWGRAGWPAGGRAQGEPHAPAGARAAHRRGVGPQPTARGADARGEQGAAVPVQRGAGRATARLGGPSTAPSPTATLAPYSSPVVAGSLSRGVLRIPRQAAPPRRRRRRRRATPATATARDDTSEKAHRLRGTGFFVVRAAGRDDASTHRRGELCRERPTDQGAIRARGGLL